MFVVPFRKLLADIFGWSGKIMTEWTHIRQDDLESMAAQRLSAAQIGERLGISRNSVIGRARRTGVQLSGVGDVERKKASMRRAWQDPKRRAKVSATAKEAWKDPEWRERAMEGRKQAAPAYSEAGKKAWADPEKRARIMAGRKTSRRRRKPPLQAAE
jgi:hypothetical protein